MSVTNINAHSELKMTRDLPVGMSDVIVLPDDQDSIWVDAPRSILQSALAALSDGRISEVVAHFDKQFKFNDHGLGLEFTEKARLIAFLEKSRELFPDTALKIVSLFQIGDYAFAEWRLIAAQTLSYASIRYRIPIDIPGCTIVRVKNAKIVQWSDYYDQRSARRMILAACFTEWIEY
jgi:hypothetical protein